MSQNMSLYCPTTNTEGLSNVMRLFWFPTSEGGSSFCHLISSLRDKKPLQSCLFLCPRGQGVGSALNVHESPR